MFYRVQLDENNVVVIIYDSQEPFTDPWDNCIDITEDQYRELVNGKGEVTLQDALVKD